LSKFTALRLAYTTAKAGSLPDLKKKKKITAAIYNSIRETPGKKYDKKQKVEDLRWEFSSTDAKIKRGVDETELTAAAAHRY
jgi:hypothetical protein